MRLSNPLRQRPGEEKYSNERIWRFLCVIAVSGVVLFVANTAGTVFAKLDSDSKTERLQRQDEQIIAVRNEGRATTCQKDREFQQAHNALVRNTQKLVRESFTASAASKPTAEERDRTLAFMRARLAEFEQNIVEVRTCTDDAINGFYSTTTTTPRQVGNG